MRVSGDDALDDDGNLLGAEDAGYFNALEVTHILPHPLPKAAPDEASVNALMSLRPHIRFASLKLRHIHLGAV